MATLPYYSSRRRHLDIPTFVSPRSSPFLRRRSRSPLKLLPKRIAASDDYLFRLIEVQDRFPYDDLGLDEGLSNIQRLKTLLNSRRKSAPAAALKAAFGKVNKSVPSIDVSLAIHSERTQETSQRKYILINEGMVQLTAGTLSHDRYLFLFNDFLLVAKCKSTSHFKLKDRVKLCEMWIADCVDDVADNVKSRDKSFVIGWPIENVVATFSSMEEKTKWKEDLASNIALQKASLDFQTTLIKIHYKDNDTAQTVSKSISVGKTDDANKVVQMSMDLFNILNKENACDYQLWVMNKDGSYPLIGHEFPFAIQMSQYREVSIVDDDNYVPSSPDSPPVHNTPSIEITPENQLQFILQKGRKVHQKVSLNRLVQLGKKKKGSKRWRKFSSTQDETSSTGKVFGKPLDQLSSEEQPIPKTINDLLVRLFRFGPSTIGVFRKTANQREVKELREEMDEGKEISFDDTSIHVLAALLKDFLRNIPNALYCSEHYEELLSTNDVTEESARIDKIISLVKKLPTPNFELTKRFFCVLYHISRNCEQNNMTPFNLGVCVAQSILKPANSTRIEYAEQAKSSAPQLVEFIIDNFPVIFGEAAMTILGDVSEIIVDTADSLGNGDTKVSEISGGSKSLRHSDSSLYKSVITEEQKNSDWMLLTVKDNSGNLSKSNPNSPVLQRKPNNAVDSKDTSKKIHSAFYHPKFSPRSLRRSLRKVTRSNSKNHRDLELSGKDSLRREKAVKLTKKASNTETIEQNAYSKTTLSSSSRLSPTVPEPAQIRRSYAPKRDRVMLASSQSIYNAPPNYAERVHSIHDRRRQPAAPSYQEHMQRTSIRRGHNVGTPNGTLRSQLRNNHKGYESGDGRHGTATKVGLELNCDFNSQDGFRSSQDLSPDPLGPSSNASGGMRLIPKKSTGSETSMSSLSSCDDSIDVVDTNKLQLTRLRHIRNFRDIPGYTSLLSPSDQITKTDDAWGHVSQDVNVEISDYQRMKMAEETYV
ncbi:rho GTPase-activating protein 20-like isoform X3 [Xenia sp. Carnegie-2017]|uniref:rho GTPase-activating protein 20-like isoform X3 n=1 Tax=Xenia sp. Carnegie-2017 TaxID=2897299 RepID=UPI001F041A85|nr:rho GTPase-activating protein 20-like isoform X3 [Xenia sp. Carnegie-2017]